MKWNDIESKQEFPTLKCSNVFWSLLPRRPVARPASRPLPPDQEHVRSLRTRAGEVRCDPEESGMNLATRRFEQRREATPVEQSALYGVVGGHLF